VPWFCKGWLIEVEVEWQVTRYKLVGGVLHTGSVSMMTFLLGILRNEIANSFYGKGVLCDFISFESSEVASRVELDDSAHPIPTQHMYLSTSRVEVIVVK